MTDRRMQLEMSSDEALVLLAFLSRELWTHDEVRLACLIEHAAESHALRALLQELIPQTIEAGDPATASAAIAAARDRLLARHS